MTMRVSPQGAGVIASYEGCYLYAYADPAHGWKVPTIGMGHTTAAGGLVVKQGQRITLAQACAMLLDDLERQYAPRVRRAIKRRLTQAVFDGFLSFDFNTGAILSGSVDDKWNSGDEAAAIVVLRQYVNAGGKRLPGLVTRRTSEAAIILAGKYPSALVLVRTSPSDGGRRVQVNALPWGMSQTVTVDGSIFQSAPPPLPTPAPRDNFLVDIGKNLWNWWNK